MQDENIKNLFLQGKKTGAVTQRDSFLKWYIILFLMPSKKHSKTTPQVDKVPITKKRSFNIIYTSVMISFFAIGILLLILSNSVFKSDVVFFIALGIIGIGIVLLTQRSVYRQTAGETTASKKDEEEMGLKLRERR